MLVGVSGRGWYQIWGEEPKEILPGTTATIPENVKHWHGSQHGGWFHVDGCGNDLDGAGGSR